MLRCIINSQHVSQKENRKKCNKNNEEKEKKGFVIESEKKKGKKERGLQKRKRESKVNKIIIFDLLLLFHFTYLCYVMFIQGVAVLELDSHPDHSKLPDPRNLCLSPSQILTNILIARPQSGSSSCDDNELRLLEAEAFPLSIQPMSRF